MSTKIDTLENEVIESLLHEILDCRDPIEQFKLIERYDAFVSARATRLRSQEV